VNKSADVREFLEPPLDVTDKRESSDSNGQGADLVRSQKKDFAALFNFWEKLPTLKRDVQLLDERRIICVPKDIGTLRETLSVFFSRLVFLFLRRIY
jgi:hypothetical protein